MSGNESCGDQGAQNEDEDYEVERTWTKTSVMTVGIDEPVAIRTPLCLVTLMGQKLLQVQHRITVLLES